MKAELLGESAGSCALLDSKLYRFRYVDKVFFFLVLPKEMNLLLVSNLEKCLQTQYRATGPQ